MIFSPNRHILRQDIFKLRERFTQSHSVSDDQGCDSGYTDDGRGRALAVSGLFSTIAVHLHLFQVSPGWYIKRINCVFECVLQNNRRLNFAYGVLHMTTENIPNPTNTRTRKNKHICTLRKIPKTYILHIQLHRKIYRLETVSIKCI